MKIKLVLACCISVFAGCWILVYLNFYKSLDQNSPGGDEVQAENSCPIKTEERTVRGDSLDPQIKNGETVKILFGYYQCHQVQREDIVVYRFSGNQDPIIKIVKGLAGDKFHLEKTEDGSGWHILVNGEILKNSEGNFYILGQSGYKMISLYEKDYKGVIPGNTYLILGNKISGSLDSTRFGLIDKSDILGKTEVSYR